MICRATARELESKQADVRPSSVPGQILTKQDQGTANAASTTGWTAFPNDS